MKLRKLIQYMFEAGLILGANTAGMCNSFKSELMNGIHALGPGTGVPARSSGVADTVKAALFLASATRGPSDTAYSTTGELAGTGNYTQGGITITMGTQPSTSGSTGIFTPSASFSWPNLTSSGSFDCCVLYNSSQSNKQISVHTFGAQSIVAGTFTLTMPANDASNALLRIA